jgi:phosphoesterase RecJ-like protein
LGVDISLDIAQNILTSIVVETNSFRLPHVRSFTFEVCARLLGKDLDFAKLTDMVYWSKTKETVILSGICLSRCKFRKEGRLVWSIVKQKDFQKIAGEDEDVDAVADDLRTIKTVQLSVLFREKTRERLRVSLRSKGEINVAHLAERFGGGGHFDCAGCFIPNTPGSIRDFLEKAESLL